MYDHLDPLFFRQTPAPRHSEPVDTHMAIQRHEQPRGRRRRGGAPHEEAAGTTLWEDSTRMSVVMLRAFLQNLLAAQTPGRTPDESAGNEGAGENAAAQDEHEARTGEQESDEQEAERALNPARKAAHAYQSTARAVHDSNYDPWVATGPAIPDDAPALNEHEAEVVRQMIRDLERLEARYIETLEIKRTTNFLQAILDSIDHVMGRN